MSEPEITADPRFLRGVELFNDREYLEASDYFEELFFEAVRDEPDFVRIFLQFSVGAHHAALGHRRPAVERVEEGLRLVESNENDRGLDLRALAAGMRLGLEDLAGRRRPRWPRIEMRVT